MPCQIFYRKNARGFSIIELIVVISVFVVLLAVSEIGFFNFRSHSDLEMATNNLVEALRHAKANAEQVQGDSKWGVGLLGNNIIVFAGTSYELRDMALDQTVSLPNGVLASGLSEIVFEKASGITLNTGSITLSNSYGNKVVNINAKGAITY